jgi:hypothetical protein
MPDLSAYLLNLLKEALMDSMDGNFTSDSVFITQ